MRRAGISKGSKSIAIIKILFNSITFGRRDGLQSDQPPRICLRNVSDGGVVCWKATRPAEIRGRDKEKTGSIYPLNSVKFPWEDCFRLPKFHPLVLLDVQIYTWGTRFLIKSIRFISLPDDKKWQG